jgi:hypothetical protein
MKKWLIAGLILFPSVAYADDDRLKKMIEILQNQRNQALDALVISDTKYNELNEELAKLKLKVQELEGKKDGSKQLPAKP